MELRATFDAVAEVYDAVRPGYPEPLFDEIADRAGLAPGDPVLEVGCGSGQATEGLHERAYAITALDPGRSLIQAARRRFAGRDDVAFVTARFEDWPVSRGAYRRVAAAQSWHWVAPQIGFEKAAQALRPDGWLAVFGHCPVRFPGWFLAAAEPVYRTYAPELWAPAPESWYLPGGPVSGLFAGSGWFGPALHSAYPWTWRHTAESFGAFLASRSDVNMLSAPNRQAFMDGLCGVVRDHGDILVVGYESHLYMGAVL
jgi:SAM-dependent methyltransferase